MTPERRTCDRADGHAPDDSRSRIDAFNVLHDEACPNQRPLQASPGNEPKMRPVQDVIVALLPVSARRPSIHSPMPGW